MISSRTNPKIKFVRRLQVDRRFRTNHAVFVVEGTRWLNEFVGNDRIPQQVFFTEVWSHDPDHAEILTQIGGLQHIVSQQVMQAMSATKTSPGVLAIVDIIHAPLPAKLTYVLILDGVSDPGNMGTLLRTANAAGVDAVILGPMCVDIYNPKVVRSTMGAHIHLPIVSLDWPAIENSLEGLHISIASATGSKLYTASDWRQPAAIIIGNEAHGPSEEASRLAEEKIYIPLMNHVESLNAAVAGAVIMFEVVRQRMLPA